MRYNLNSGIRQQFQGVISIICEGYLRIHTNIENVFSCQHMPYMLLLIVD